MLEKLTAEQEAQIPVYVDKWIDIGLRTGSADRLRAEEGVRKTYKAINVEPPKEFVWRDSPYAGWQHAKEVFPNDVGPCYGQHEAYWLSFYSFCKEVCNIEGLDILDGLFEIAESCGWWWAYDDLAILTERPSKLFLDDQGRLHSETEKAISYPDGWGFYSWHGVAVPEKVILDPKSLSVEEIQAEPNIEVRRIMIERFGVGDYLHQTNAEIVDMDASSPLGGAPRMLMRDKSGLQYLCGTDGSTERVYFMSVPDDAKTCREAHERISGISEDMIVAEC